MGIKRNNTSGKENPLQMQDPNVVEFNSRLISWSRSHRPASKAAFSIGQVLVDREGNECTVKRITKQQPFSYIVAYNNNRTEAEVSEVDVFPEYIVSGPVLQRYRRFKSSLATRDELVSADLYRKWVENGRQTRNQTQQFSASATDAADTKAATAAGEPLPTQQPVADLFDRPSGLRRFNRGFDSNVTLPAVQSQSFVDYSRRFTELEKHEFETSALGVALDVKNNMPETAPLRLGLYAGKV